jgi:diphosphomevalonate decarboxylase
VFRFNGNDAQIKKGQIMVMDTPKKTQKRSFRASPDVALIKYWGKKDPILRLPENNSISLILKGLDTITTVEFRDDFIKDDIEIYGNQSEMETERIVEHLDLFRKLANASVHA